MQCYACKFKGTSLINYICQILTLNNFWKAMSGFGSDYNEKARTNSDQSRGGGRNELHLLGIKKPNIIKRFIMSYWYSKCFLICKCLKQSIFNIIIRNLNLSWKLQKLQGSVVKEKKKRINTSGNLKREKGFE